MISLFGARTFNPKTRFWRRRFSDSVTGPQVTFDVIFGIVMPIICFYFDPGVFRRGSMNDRYFSVDHYVMVIYLFSATAIVGLSLWLAFTQQMARYAPILAGAFIPAAVFSFIVGILMLPITLIGLIFVIGVLGFVPFATGIVFLRNAKRAIATASLRLKSHNPVQMIVIAAIVSIVAPVVIQWQAGRVADKSINELVNDNTRTDESDIKTAKYLRWFANTDTITQAYDQEPNKERKERLATIYKEIINEDIDAHFSFFD